jgi:hypothetical protein
VAEFCQHSFLDDTRLCVEIRVPSKLVGRIIGKGGSNVSGLYYLNLNCNLFKHNVSGS